jgi:uncharacterized protein YecE (DUF72 family)
LSCVEINSSFYRPHAYATYARWAASTPETFRFSVKVPKALTHEQLLRRPQAILARFLEETSGLGGKRGPILIQLPPSMTFERRAVSRFLDCLRRTYDGPVVCEPRHPTWFTASAERLLSRHRIARAAADPLRAENADRPGGWDGLAYFRLHGSPRMYWSKYDTGYLARLRRLIHTVRADADCWIVFDNTAAGAAFENAWELKEMLADEAPDRITAVQA